MSYQNLNQYNFRKFRLLPVNEITDICLASDERDYDQEVVFSPLLIGENDGNRMPFKFDFNSSGQLYVKHLLVLLIIKPLYLKIIGTPTMLTPTFVQSLQSYVMLV